MFIFDHRELVIFGDSNKMLFYIALNDPNLKTASEY